MSERVYEYDSQQAHGQSTDAADACTTAQAGCAEASATEGEKPRQKRAKKSIDQQIAEAEERLRKLKRRQRNEERAARTHRLVETGAVVEAALGIEFIDKADRERLMGVLTERHRRDDGQTWTWADALAHAYERRADEGGAR